MPSSNDGAANRPQFTHTLTQVANILAPAVRQPGEELRAAIDKVRKRVEYAVETGELQTQGVSQARCYCLPLVIAWAREKWPGNFLALPAEHDKKAKSGVGFGDQLGSNTYPGDLDWSHDALKQAYGQIKELGAALKAAYAEIDRLEPLAAKYENIREKNRQSAQRPRGGDA